MTYFVTGATGFIGRHLVARLLAHGRDGRVGEIHVLVREGSMARLQALTESWGRGAAEPIHPVIGELSKPRLGVSEDLVDELSSEPIEHFFHLAAIYD